LDEDVTNSSDVNPGEILSFGPFRLIASERLITRDGAPVNIGGRAMDLLIALVSRSGAIVTGRELVNLVWQNVIVEEANLRVHIAALRRNLGDGQAGFRYIVNVPGRGYSFVAPIERSTPERSPQASFGPPAGHALGLPQPPPVLIGRSETVSTLTSLLLSRRFVTVVGPGGIGKTSVALAIGNTLLKEFGDGVCFVDLGSLSDPADVPGTMAAALGCLVQGPDAEPYIRAFLADKRLLLILDSCEHVAETVASISERLFGASEALHILATGREALRADGENVHLLMPLSCPPEEDPTVEQALAAAAVQLFMKRAASSGHKGDLSDADAPIVANICRRLDGIALAIELVASRVGSYGIGGTADLLESGHQLMLQGRRNALPRHRSLHAMLDWSYNLLTPAERGILRRLSVFAGSFTLAAAQSVAGDAGDEDGPVVTAIASLVDKSLIWIPSRKAQTHYRLYDTTRDYAASRLVEAGEEDTAAKLHARHYIDFLKSPTIGEPAFDGRHVGEFAVHVGNVRKALAWSFSATGDRSMGVELAAFAAPLFLDLSAFAECLQWCRRALLSLPEADLGTARELALLEAFAMSSIYTWGDSKEVKGAIEHGLRLAESLQDTPRQLRLLANLNVYLTRRGDFGGALEAAGRSAAVAERGGGVSEKLMAAWMMGASYHLAGDQAAGLRNCELGFRLAGDSAPPDINLFFEARARFSLARTLWLSGFPARGRKSALETISRMARYSHHFSYCVTLVFSTPVLLWARDFSAAAQPIDQAINQAKRYSLSTFHALGLALKGELEVLNGDAASGVKILEQALTAMKSDQYLIVVSAASRALAEGLARTGRYDEALDTINGAIERVENSREMWLPDLLRTRGEILLATSRPDFDGAEETLMRAIGLAQKQSALGWELKAALPLARMWSQIGRIEQARRVLDVLCGRFTEGFGTPDLADARRLLTDLAPKSRKGI
jgi:predicted ATPase/DNA-binding winged helix-turn-helix (wHTH) protein